MTDKLRKQKDEAAKLAQKGKFDKALEAYQNILKEDATDLTAQLKCGDILRKLNRGAEAITYYTRIAQTYAENGFLLKAIAACKLILEIDAEHTDTQRMLADLYAKKTGRTTPTAPLASKPAPSPAAEKMLEVSDDDIVALDADDEANNLPSIPLFSDLPKNAFIQLMEQMRMRSVLPEEGIIREGEVDDSMFIISTGRVKVTKTSEKGSEMILARLGDGAFFGEMALLSESPRTASVIAEEETLLFQVSRDILAQVVKNFPSVANIMLKFYRQRLLTNLMATSPIFKPLDVAQRKALIEKFKSREVSAQEKLLEEGQPGDGLYMLLSGRAEVSRKIDGQRKVLAHLKEGDVFGEMSLLQDQPVTANVKTLRKSIVLKLPRKVFTEMASIHPQLLVHISDIKNERDKTNDAIIRGQLAFGEEGLVVV